jgi:hypothetical protein
MNCVYQFNDLDFVHCVVGFCKMCRDLLNCDLMPWNFCSDFRPIGFIRFTQRIFCKIVLDFVVRIDWTMLSN